MSKTYWILSLMALFFYVHGLPDDVTNEQQLDTVAVGDDDLKPAENYGFGYYGSPLIGLYGPRYYGWNSYDAGWKHHSYRSYARYNRPIYYVWG